MKTAKYVAIAFVAVLGLTGCESSSDSEPKTVTETVTASPETESSSPETAPDVPGEQIYLQVLEERAYFATTPDSDLLELGHSTCSLLDSGQSVEDVAMIGVDSGVPAEEVGYLTGVAITALCPQHEAALDEFIDMYGGGGTV